MNDKLLISTKQPRVIKKMITVFNLANNFHSIDGSDLQEDIKTLLIEEIILDFNEHLFKYLKNGHTKYNAIVNIKNLDDALDFAKCSFIKASSR